MSIASVIIIIIFIPIRSRRQRVTAGAIRQRPGMRFLTRQSNSETSRGTRQHKQRARQSAVGYFCPIRFLRFIFHNRSPFFFPFTFLPFQASLFIFLLLQRVYCIIVNFYTHILYTLQVIRRLRFVINK